MQNIIHWIFDNNMFVQEIRIVVGRKHVHVHLKVTVSSFYITNRYEQQWLGKCCQITTWYIKSHFSSAWNVHLPYDVLCSEREISLRLILYVKPGSDLNPPARVLIAQWRTGVLQQRYNNALSELFCLLTELLLDYSLPHCFGCPLLNNVLDLKVRIIS